MKVLVTGGTGFIGSHLIETLIKKHYSVICVAKDRGHCDSFRSTAVTTIICDLNNGVNWKYHCQSNRPNPFANQNSTFPGLCYRGDCRSFWQDQSSAGVF